MKLTEIANKLKTDDARIIILFAFNTVGKTRLSVSYKDATKLKNGSHAGVYYNAYSEDLFIWDNDEKNDGADIRLLVKASSLSRFHSSLTEESIRTKLKPYKPKYDFEFSLHDDAAEGIQSISFFIPDSNPEVKPLSINLSRGEELIFVWCFFLALFELEGWAGKQSSHFFIDDPVSSLDDHNIFVTASTIFNLIEEHYKNRKIIVATHHIGLFAILSDWLTKGEKSASFKPITQTCTLSEKSGALTLESCRNDVFLYHLRLLQVLEHAKEAGDLKSFHLALLRQVLENVSSFLGVGRVSYVLEQIGIDNADEVSSIINTLSHKKVYYFESDELVPDNIRLFNNVFEKLKSRYNFVLHA